MINKLPFIILTFCMFLMNTVSLSAAIDNLERNKDIAQINLHSTATRLGEDLKNIKGEKKRINLIRSFIDPIRFYPDKSGYFYVYDYNCVNMAHATQKQLVEKDLRNYRDCKGKFVIRELAEAAKKGGGFVEYYWVKPGIKGEHKKIGYVEPIPNTEYFIGTGVYLAEMTLGETLVRQLWTDMKETDMKAINETISEGFQAVHQYGTNNRQQEIELISKLCLGDYTLSDIKITQNGPLIIATYFVSVNETIKGKRLSKKSAPRLSVFLKVKDGWQWIAHANLKPLEEREK